MEVLAIYRLNLIVNIIFTYFLKMKQIFTLTLTQLKN